MRKEESNVNLNTLLKNIESEIANYDKDDSSDQLTLLKNVRFKLISQRNQNYLYFILSTFIFIITALFVYDTSERFDKFFGEKQTEFELKKDSVDGIFRNIRKSIDENFINGMTITYRIDNKGNIITYHDLVRRNDSLVNERNELNSKILRDSIYIKNLERGRKEDGEYIDKYYNLLNEYNDLKWQFDYVKEVYNIKVNISRYKKKGKDYTTIVVDSKRIDSLEKFYDKYRFKIKDLEKK